jgi:hypothetical protein
MTRTKTSEKAKHSGNPRGYAVPADQSLQTRLEAKGVGKGWKIISVKAPPKKK